MTERTNEELEGALLAVTEPNYVLGIGDRQRVREAARRLRAMDAQQKRTEHPNSSEEQSPDEVMVEMQLLVNDLKSAITAIEVAAELLGTMVPSHAEAEDNDPVEI